MTDRQESPESAAQRFALRVVELEAQLTRREAELKATLKDLAAREQELAEAIYQRDLAIAHDRQPYPTAWAYEQVCKTLEKTKRELADARGGRVRAEESYEKYRSEALKWQQRSFECDAQLRASRRRIEELEAALTEWREAARQTGGGDEKSRV